MNAQTLKEIQGILDYEFKNPELLETALSHSSYANQYGVKSNERLEFFGDTILGYVVSEIIYSESEFDEGKLSKLRALIVSMKPLSTISKESGLDKYLLFSGINSRMKPTDAMLSDMVEAIVAAIYLDGGIEEVKKFVDKFFRKLIAEIEGQTTFTDSKSMLQETLTKSQIEYESIKTGPDHRPTFKAQVVVDGEILGEGISSDKRSAEQKAAAEALHKIKEKQTGK